MSAGTMQCDLLVIGGGPVGLTLALGAARLGLKVGVVEQEDAPVAEETASPGRTSFDGRMLALNQSSRRLLEQVGVWAALAPLLTPIRHVHVSQRGYAGVVTLHADDMGLDALGYSVLGRDLGRVLWGRVEAEPRITLFRPAELIRLMPGEEAVTAALVLPDGHHTLKARLLVGADGTHSTVRQQMGWPLQTRDYGSHAVLARVESWRPHAGWAFERFTPEGPVALLPWGTHSHKAVYVCPDTQLDALMALDDEAWLAAFSRRMGPRCGGFRAVTPRVAYPLRETYVPRVAEGRVVLMGNASHTQHPVAAQGLNLGLRDVADCLERLRQPQALSDPGQWVADYERSRQRDHRRVMGMTDGLISLFQIHQPLAGHLRGVGLMLMQGMPVLKKRMALMGMGLDG